MIARLILISLAVVPLAGCLTLGQTAPPDLGDLRAIATERRSVEAASSYWVEEKAKAAGEATDPATVALAQEKLDELALRSVALDAQERDALREIRLDPVQKVKVLDQIALALEPAQRESMGLRQRVRDFELQGEGDSRGADDARRKLKKVSAMVTELERWEDSIAPGHLAAAPRTTSGGWPILERPRDPLVHAEPVVVEEVPEEE